MFVMSWWVLFLGIKPEWTSWGLLSGLLWVLGGTGGIYAIRMAGLAIAVGTWASVMILVNFVWGILIFREPVDDVLSTVGAFFLLTVGLVGMSHFSSLSVPAACAQPVVNKKNEDSGLVGEDMLRDDEGETQIESQQPYSAISAGRDGLVTTTEKDSVPDEMVVFWNSFSLTKQNAGIAGAIFNGLTTGSSLIPLHYAKARGFGGAHYMISFAGGALIANSLLWLSWFVISFESSLENTLRHRMPDWHFQKMVMPGCAAGVLLSIAMFGSIMAVTSLGQGIGNSIVQTKILISGLWGIAYFKEIQGGWTITNWFLSAALTVSGILWLSHERMLAMKGN